MLVRVKGDPLPCGMKYHRNGDEVDVDDRYGAILVKLGRAERVVKKKKVKKKSKTAYKTRQMVADSE